MRVANFARTARNERPTELSRPAPGQVFYRPPGWLLPVGFAALLISVSALYLTTSKLKSWNGLDALVYWHGADDLWHARSIYDAIPAFTYPPAAAVFFTPMLLLPPVLAAKALSLLSLGLLFLIIWISLGMLGVAEGRGKLGVAAVLTAAAMWLQPAMLTFQFGQINLVLLILVIGDIATPDRSWRKGIGVGLAAGIKLVPGLFIVYFLATRRWRAAAVASATFAASVALGFVAAPHDSVLYWLSIDSQSDRIARGQLWYVSNQSVHGLLERTFGGTHLADRLWLVAAVAIVAAAVWLAVRASARGNQLLAAVLVSLGSVLVSPISWTHHWVFIVVLFLVVGDAIWRWPTTRPRPAWSWYAWPAVLLPLVFLNWAPTADGLGLVGLVPNDSDPPPGMAPELHWTWPQHLVGEAYTIAGLMFLIGCAVLLYRTAPQSTGIRDT